MIPLKVRGLGSSGIVTDGSPYDIESISVLSAGVNVRFSSGRVTRGPLAKTILNLPFEPAYMMTLPPVANGVDEVVIIEDEFASIRRVNGTVFEDLTPDDWAPVGGTDRYTSTILGGVAYLNRFSHVPVYKAPGDDKFQTLPGWNPAWRCSKLVAYKDFLVAIGCLVDGVSYPTMVKWSDRTGFGAPPPNWSVDDPTSLGGQNIVNEMQHAIIDAATLRDSLILYCTNSVWTMDFNGSDLLFSWRKLFDSWGIINENCAVQIGALHYVFDQHDIYIHDGVEPRSIADGKVQSFIFDALDTSKKHLCFVSHDPILREVRFHYPSFDRLVGFDRPTTGCNRAAVFNYDSQTWTFYDTPNVTAATYSAFSSSRIWDEPQDETEWNLAEGAWNNSSEDASRHMLYVGRSDPDQGLTAPRLYGFEPIDGGRLPFPIEPEALKPALMERTGIDLDATGKPLSDYVRIMEIRPQMSIENPSQGFWYVGGNDVVDDEPEFSGPYEFNPRVDKKIDINEGGQYLAWRLIVTGTGGFKLSGFDLLTIPGGRR